MRPSILLGIALDFKENLIHTIKGNLTLDVVLINLLMRMRMFKSLVIGNSFTIKLPGKIRIFINDAATLSVNIPDHYLRREYMKHPDYVPSKGWIVLDIGAYVGIYSLWASKLVDDSFVVAFEPNPLAFRWLINNVKLNNVANIKALLYALGDDIGKQKLYIAGENVEASSLIVNHIVNNPSGKYLIAGEYVVPVVTLDYIINRFMKIIGKSTNYIDLTKIDVEGYEMKVLKDAEETLRKGLINKFAIEVHIDQVNTEKLIKYLSDKGFALDMIKY
jgi:methyltransferase, FkbM family